METKDPDDFLTLLLLAGHPAVNLRAVTVTPGTPAQIAVVRRGLALLERGDVRVGAFDPGSAKDAVSPWHWDVLGPLAPVTGAESGPALLTEMCDAGTTLVCGAPLKNLRAAVTAGGFTLGRLVVQGGFAGAGVVPPAAQLPQFQGKVTCPSYNLNGDPKAVFVALACPGIGERRFVSKNVCHGVVYDAGMHGLFAAVRDRNPALALIHRAMGVYLERRPEGKMFHDPLAACCAIDPGIGTWAEVEIFRSKGEWGSRLAPGSGTWIITGYDRERFIDTLTR